MFQMMKQILILNKDNPSKCKSCKKVLSGFVTLSTLTGVTDFV